MSTVGQQPGGAPSEEELRAAYEAEIKKIRVEHVVLEHVVTLVNLGMRRTGLAPGTEAERDPEQVRVAIEAIRAVLPLIEQSAPQQVAPIKEALSQLQLAYVKIGGQPAAGGEGPAGPHGGAGPGAAGGGAGPGAAGGGAGPGAAGGGAGPAGSGGGAGPGGGAEPERPQPKSGEPGPAQRSGRLWVPGQ